MRSSLVPFAWVVASTLGCNHQAAVVATAHPTPIEPTAETRVPSAPAPRDDGRLPPTVIPRGYNLSFRIDPNQPRFAGVTTILVDVPAPTTSVVLNARDMNVTRSVARVGAVDVPATATSRAAHDSPEKEELILTFARPLPQGQARIQIAYDAPFSSDLAGLYRAEEGGRYYVFSQFEATSARRAFPCFDEPGFKTPYDVTVTAPPDTVALANSPEMSTSPAEGGMVTHVFGTTPPLPSYLTAFAVGPFDVIEGQKEPVPIRVVTTRGHGGMTHLALDVAAALVSKLSDYFDMRYPYAKLDLVAVPDFAAGAMENPGLVTFRDVLLLIDPERTTVAARRRQAAVIAHEFAHQWFGDLVTMQWWDDLWLNEGFATWAEAKIVDSWQPAFGATLEQIAGTQHVMDVDAMASSRAVRQPVRSTGEADEAFDGITYDKGAAVLRTLEIWLGADVFRRGIQRYLSTNAWKNARADDLFTALEFVSTQRVGDLARGLLDEPGVPEVLATLRCQGGDGRVDLSQSEWRPLGAPPRAPKTWTLPVCVTSDAAKAKSCFTLGNEPISRSLGGRCPSWIHPNAGLAGYYRFVVDRKNLFALAAAGPTMSTADRLGIVSNAWAGVRQGTIDAGVMLDLLPSFDADSNRYIVDQIAQTLTGIDRALVAPSARSRFAKYVAARFGARKKALGWGTEAAAGADDETALARRTVLITLGGLAHDPVTLEEADTYAVRWLADPTSLSSETASVAVPLASLRAGAARLLELRAAARSAKLPQDRVIALRAMGMFDDPAVLRAAFDVTLSDEIKLSELGYVFGGADDGHERRDTLFAWEKDNWARLRARLPGPLSRGLAGVLGSACTAQARDEARTFFVPAMKGIEGVKRGVEQALESADLCIALRDHEEERVTHWLERHF